ncbi:hypothetical protein MMC11_008290 [Xylographa trunciseda]|nr:hypothetical protein [Xylographa trunciseda]
MRLISGIALLFTFGHFTSKVNGALQSSTLVALSGQANTGLVPGPLDAALTGCLGPRYYNALIENEVSGDGAAAVSDLSCLIKCGTTVAKVLPCIVKAIATGNPLDILKCGVGKTQICTCAQCFPDKIKKWVNEHFCDNKSALLDAPPTNELSNVDVVGIQESNIKAMLGLTTEKESKDLTAMGFCPGSSCGSCSCCIGACLFGNCLGACLPLAAAEIKAGLSDVAVKTLDAPAKAPAA